MCSKIGSEGCSAKPSLFGDKRAKHENEELDPIKHEDFREAKQYLKDKSIENGRMAFRIRTQMSDKIPGNFKNKYKKEQEKLKCSYCNLNQEMTQMHCLDLRTDLDLKNINDLVLQKITSRED